MTINTKALLSVLRQLGSVASVVIGSAGTGNLPPAVRSVLVAGGAVILAAEHFVSALKSA